MYIDKYIAQIESDMFRVAGSVFWGTYRGLLESYSDSAHLASDGGQTSVVHVDKKVYLLTWCE